MEITPDPLRLAPHELNFAELKELVEYLEQIQDGADSSLGYFRHDREGFQHRVDPKKGEATETSKASTATCLAYLQATGKLESWPTQERRDLRNRFIDEDWSSAGLEEDNAFTVAFLLEAILALGGPRDLTQGRAKRLGAKIIGLNGKLREKGGLEIDPYLPTAFLTHKAVRVLQEWGRLTETAAKSVASWNWKHLYEESMLIASGSPDADFFELAYGVLTASRTSPLAEMTPRRRRLLQHAIEQFFVGQRDDGTWPRSRPLFLYPNIGYAYCYDYELLVQLISERPLRPFLLPHIKELREASWALEARRVPLGGGGAFGWSSEHHGSTSDAESWPTASVFHFCFELRQLIADAVRRDVFDFVDATYVPPKPTPGGVQVLHDLMDSNVRYRKRTLGFNGLITKNFVEPLVKEREQVRAGRSFEEDTNVSLILYGPPGTSKTRLAGLVADALGWPLLALDPSHLTRRGLEHVHKEADEVFSRLQLSDQIVVLLDEFDELVREREVAGEFESRFLTTAMLPKIAALHGRRRLVYIVATNHVEQFDAAISRPGRFDLILPLMPPKTKAKLEKWPELEEVGQGLRAEGVTERRYKSSLGDLTYAEAQALARRGKAALAKGSALLPLFQDISEAATLRRKVDPEDEKPDESPDWKERIKQQESKIQGIDY